jgi:hypothetical protein
MTSYEREEPVAALSVHEFPFLEVTTLRAPGGIEQCGR